MCGIAGVISLKDNNITSNLNSNELGNMLTRIRDRGPDGMGIDVGGDYAIGNVRLRIVGHDQGKQPVKEGKNLFVFNGEVYNYKHLSTKYNLNNIHSDTYLLFQLLVKQSVSVLSEINGMFAFCYIDENSIYLGRDRFGKKPLFYTISNDNLYFASEMKAFLSIIDFKMELSKTYMALETEIGENTIFKNIFQIPAGGYLKIDRKSKEISKINYFNITPQDHTNKTEKQLIEELRYLVTDAVNLRTDTDKPYAVYVSGGIDSSIVALLSKPKYIFSFIPNSTIVSNEDIYADILASKMKQSPLIKVTNDNNEFLKNFIDFVYMNEGPTTTLGALAQYCLSREVKKYDIKLALSGIGADEFMNGYVRHAVATTPVDLFKGSLFKSYKPLIDKSEALNSDISPELIYSNLLNRSNYINPALHNLVSSFFTTYKNSLTAISMADAHFTLPPLLRNDDYLNMGFSIESRSPFMDYRIIEFSLGLPQHLKINIDKKYNKINTKYLLRKAFKDILPKEIYNRNDKIGFTSNVSDLIRSNMRFVFNISYELLQSVYPNHPFLTLLKNQLKQYDRWDYQICQIAVTYLLFMKQFSKDEVYDYFMLRSKTINPTFANIGLSKNIQGKSIRL